MIQEYEREMTAAERAELERALRPGPQPASTLPYTLRALSEPALALAFFAGVGLVVVVLEGPGPAVLLGVLTLVYLYKLGAAYVRHVRMRNQHTDFFARYDAERRQEITRVLEDGRVTVKRVRAVAVVKLEPIEDEGFGYIYDLGDGRVLFLKGQDYEPLDEDEPPWPNTEFEIVHAKHDGRVLELYCRGQALAPLRVIQGEECDPQKAWDAREEVLDLSLDEAVKTILRAPAPRSRSRRNPAT